MKMKKDVVFKPNYDDNEDSSSDSEIEIIPYTKPPPVVIDLLESENENEDEQECSTPKKKKSKKKKSKRHKERNRVGGEGSSNANDNASTVCSASQESFQSLSRNHGDSVASQQDANILRSDVPALESSQDVEQGSVTANREIPEQSDPSSDNVTRKDSAAATPSSSILDDGRRESSAHESSRRKESHSSSTAETSISLAGSNSVTATPPPKVPLQGPSPVNENRGSNRAETPRGKGGAGGRGRGRARASNVHKRTNEEILNFLTTIGIEMTSSAYDTPPPKRRQRQPKKGTENIEDNAVSNNNNNDETPSPFVSVTQECARSNKKGVGKRKRQATDGDISDFTVAFTNDELNAINTSIQSNIVLPQTSNDSLRVSSYDEVIDMVARRGPLNSLETATSTTAVEESKNQGENIQVEGIGRTSEVEAEKRSSKETHSGPDSPESSLPATENNIHNQNENLEGKGKLETVASQQIDIPIDDNTINTSDISENHRYSGDSAEVPTNQTSAKATQCGEKENEPPPAPTTNNAVVTGDEGKPVETTHNDLNTDASSSNSARNPVLSEMSVVAPFQTTEQSVLRNDGVHEGFFPTTWTVSMREFYDTERDAGFELDDVWTMQTDAPHAWTTPKDLMRPPKSKRDRIRCNRCKQLGHFIKECREPYKPPTCHMCGETGHTSDHSSRFNPACNAARCLNCSHKLNQYAQKCTRCLLRNHPGRCSVCNVMGHNKELCPDNWRRYHSITDWNELFASQVNTNQKEKVYKRNSLVYCANCSKKGHSYYDCNGSRFNPYHRNKPFVVHKIQPINNESNRRGPSSAVASSSKVTEETLYDPKTGRAVVLNIDASNLQEIAVETIQVKITNDLANTSTPAIIKCPLLNCTNMINENERCNQTIMQEHAHAKLLKAQEHGHLKELEKNHNVQISIITGEDNSKIHIFGKNSKEAERDLYRFLWKKTKQVESQQHSGNERETQVPESASKTNSELPIEEEILDCIVIDDESDDDICVIEEIPAKKEKTEISIENQKEKRNPKPKTNKEREDTPNERCTSQNEHHLDILDSTDTQLQLDQSRSNLDSYESPLTGLPLPNKRSRFDDYQGTVDVEMNPICVPDHAQDNNFSSYPNPWFDPLQTFQQLPPNPNPFFGQTQHMNPLFRPPPVQKKRHQVARQNRVPNGHSRALDMVSFHTIKQNIATNKSKKLQFERKKARKLQRQQHNGFSRRPPPVQGSSNDGVNADGKQNAQRNHNSKKKFNKPWQKRAKRNQQHSPSQGGSSSQDQHDRQRYFHNGLQN